MAVSWSVVSYMQAKSVWPWSLKKRGKSAVTTHHELVLRMEYWGAFTYMESFIIFDAWLWCVLDPLEKNASNALSVQVKHIWPDPRMPQVARSSFFVCPSLFTTFAPIVWCRALDLWSHSFTSFDKRPLLVTTVNLVALQGDMTSATTCDNMLPVSCATLTRPLELGTNPSLSSPCKSNLLCAKSVSPSWKLRRSRSKGLHEIRPSWASQDLCKLRKVTIILLRIECNTDWWLTVLHGTYLKHLILI